jgi:DNA-binding transcriptional ArsR family regulator
MKQKIRSREWLEVKEKERAAVLLEDKTLRFLVPFVGRESSADDAAKQLGVSLTTLVYQLKRLQGFGLLELIREKKRRGSSIKLYRATGDAFFIPFRATPYERPEELLLRDYDPLHRKLLACFLEAAIEFLGMRSVDEFGLRITLEGKHLSVRHAPNPKRTLEVDPTKADAPAILNQWEELKLNFEDAKALQRDLATVLNRYRSKSGSGSYLAHVAVAPTTKNL